MRPATLAGLLASALLAACSKAPAPTAVAPTKPAYGSFGVDLAQMDTSAKPGDDFYRYVNGKWLDSFQIPPDSASYSSRTILFEKTEADLHAILDELAASKPSPGSVEQKVADVYASWMDEAGIEARGLDPLLPFLARIDAVKDKAGLMQLVGSIDFQAPFALSIESDTADPTRYTVWVNQSGLGMPNREYYLEQGEKFDAYRAAYATYVTKVFELLGDKDPTGSAKRVIGIENKIAAVAWAPERRRKVNEVNNPMDLAGLEKLVPNVDWQLVLAGLGLSDAQHFLVRETTAIRDGAKLLDSEPLAAWKAYMTFHFVDSYGYALPKAFDDAQFDFYLKALRGVEQQRDRWKRGMVLVDAAIGEGLGQIYVRKHFTPATKAKMEQLVANLRAALRERLATLSWMDDTTRAGALKKLDAFEACIGYPDKWRDYSALNVVRGKHFENARNARLFDWQRRVKRFHESVDRGEWYMTPQTVGAYNAPIRNQITFPAGFLQPPFFDPNADAAVNYGAIGAIIGHEFSHGFDDQGRQFDESGKLRNWWTPATSARFIETTTKLGALYATYCPLEGACVNSELTMGENIGDLGGLELAYAAYQLSLQGREAPVLDGFTGDQRFFLSFAQAYRSKSREDALRAQMLTDPHSPYAARGTFPERNMDAWYAAFDVRPGDKLYIDPEDRVKIW